MRAILFDFVSIVVVGLFLLNGLMYLRQPGMIFFPFRDLEATPADWGLAYEDVSIVTEDQVRLHGWYIPKENSKKVLLFFHGNAGNISHRGDSIKIFHRLGLNVFIIDYRGYGQSLGFPGEQGLYLDALAAWSYLLSARGFANEDIIIFGRSLGGAVAAQLASNVQPGALIVESTFSSAKDFARVVFPILSRLVVTRYDFNTAKHVQQVTCPLLVLHSPQDEIIPFRLGEKIYQSANEPKSFVELRGDHNGGFLLSQPGYERQLGVFIDAHLRVEQ